MQVIQVDDIGFQAAQAVFAGGLNGGGAAVDDAHQFAVAVDIKTLQAAFTRQREAAAVRAHDPADQRFVGTEAVERGGVEQRDAAVERRQQQP